MTSLVFPGQGSQYIGMGKEFYEKFQEVKDVFEEAEKVTDIPVKKLCFEGPLSELTKTENLQVCLTTVNIACFLGLRLTSQGKLGVKFVAGHSLGEYSALFVAGVLSLEDTLRAVKLRGKLMGKAGGKEPSGMYAVIGMPLPELEALVQQAEDLVIVSNYNSPKQLVISGREPACGKVAEACKKRGARVVKLKVSAAFHSPLMEEAQKEFSEFLETLTWKKPVIPFVSNVTGNGVTSAEEIKSLMKKQITSPVRWIDCVNYIYYEGCKTFVEVGPKRVLSGLISQILEGKDFKVFNVEKPEDAEKLLTCLPYN